MVFSSGPPQKKKQKSLESPASFKMNRTAVFTLKPRAKKTYLMTLLHGANMDLSWLALADIQLIADRYEGTTDLSSIVKDN